MNPLNPHTKNLRLVRHPWIWVARFRKRRGYGVHSPWAFAFITGVIGERTPYYAYQRLDRLHPALVRAARLYPLRCRRLLFRLANYARPATVCCVGLCPTEREYIRAAVPSARWLQADEGTEAADFVFVGAPHIAEAPSLAQQMPRHGMLVVEGIHRTKTSLALWHSIQQAPHTGITFDLFTYGIAFFDPSRHKQHYKVNF